MKIDYLDWSRILGRSASLHQSSQASQEERFVWIERDAMERSVRWERWFDGLSQQLFDVQEGLQCVIAQLNALREERSLLIHPPRLAVPNSTGTCFQPPLQGVKSEGELNQSYDDGKIDYPTFYYGGPISGLGRASNILEKRVERSDGDREAEELLAFFEAPIICLMEVQGRITDGVSFYNFFHEELNVVLEMQNYHALVGLYPLHHGETDVGYQFGKEGSIWDSGGSILANSKNVRTMKHVCDRYKSTSQCVSNNKTRIQQASNLLGGNDSKITVLPLKQKSGSYPADPGEPQNDRRRRQLPVDDKVEKAREKANCFTSKFPYFLSQMTNAGTRRGGVLHIPSGFRKQHFPRGRMQMVLQSPDGTPWEVSYISNRYQGSLSRGWDAFSRYHNLAVGDFCTFELVDEKTLRAQIFHVVE
ncbi:hypothetical protein ACLOJK_038669 [Asimina triloba]